MDEHNPSLLMHCVWEDGNILDEDLGWEIGHIQNDPDKTKNFTPEFVKDTIHFLEELSKIPENERLNEWHEEQYPDPVQRAEIIKIYDILKASRRYNLNSEAKE
jgi:hypothetical protein